MGRYGTLMVNITDSTGLWKVVCYLTEQAGLALVLVLEGWGNIYIYENKSKLDMISTAQ